MKLKVKSYQLLSSIYFFLNHAILPKGLALTSLFSPILYLWIYKIKGDILLRFFVLISPFILAHFILGVNIQVYLTSFSLLIAAYVSSYAFHIFVITRKNTLPFIFKNLLILNGLLTIVAIIGYYTKYRDLFWWTMNYTSGYNDLPRLRMFTYEPSHYAMLMLPIFVYYFIDFFRVKTIRSLLYLIIISTPMALTFSLGVFAGFLISLFLTLLIQANRRFISSQFLKMYLFLFLLGLFVLLMLLFFYPDNPLFVRIISVLSSADSSGKGRTTDALYIGYEIAKLKSLIWGVGLGQVKLIGHDFIINYYNYQDLNMVVRIPNVVADTLATFGFAGLFIRFLTIFFLFIRTHVLRNYYRTLLFIFIFIYQFSGSYYTNIVEYVIWILAFSSSFSQFDTNNKFRKNESSISVASHLV